MRKTIAALLLLLAAAAGCSISASSDTAPTVLGFSPAMRDTLRTFIRTSDPNANVNAAVTSYMRELRETAKKLKISPNSDGDILIPTDLKLPNMVQGPAEVDEGLEILREFDAEVPDWAQALIQLRNNGELPKPLEDLLVATVRAELLQLQIQLEG